MNTVWLEKIKEWIKGASFIKVVVNKPINIEYAENIHINSNNNSPVFEYNEDRKLISINYKKLEPQDKENFANIAKEAVRRDDAVTLEKKSEERAEDIRSKEGASDVQAFLDYFKDKISPDDFAVLRAAVYIRKRFEAGADSSVIYELKGDIIRKYGTRGLTINNLYSSKYFENVIKLLYEGMKDSPDFSKEEFLEQYNAMISEASFAVFVSERKNAGEIRGAIEGKIIKILNYGIKKPVSIHGIGKSNIEMIKRIIPDIEDKYPHIKKSIQERAGIILVKFWF